ncbi:MORN repeat-containing protein [Paenibacillus eucommiae]|uniref:MORN repeat-containing protein n=1 Tax=Paenibacillus eucommiae TaxID=1355755 RepID=A0ABS4IPR7_9BACL|nr:hypothetical protein [Paenibacillus eucommiae]MBP1989558.1 hypothetical protein [Paenibacillus eucommiae]
MNFKAFEKEMPDIYILADDADRALSFDLGIALGHLKEIGRLLIKKILMNEQVKLIHTEPLLNLQAILNIEILPEHLVSTLKQLEFIDTRESAMLLESSKVNQLMINIYDLTSWYIKTYINDQFSPPPLLLRPQITTLHSLSNAENETNDRKSITHIEDKIVEGIWVDGNEDEYYIELEANETYKGQISNGMKSGKGVYRWSDGTKYEGQWYKDSEYGFGIKEYANGDCYRGEWKEGLFHGKGTYEWNDGTKFEGNWQDNLEHGYGVKTYSDGSIQKGFWTLGELIYTEDQLREGKVTIFQLHKGGRTSSP